MTLPRLSESVRASRFPHGVAPAIAVGVIARLLILLASIGSNDARIWQAHARAVDHLGLWQAYAADAFLNHPPLPVLWAWLAYQVGGESIHPFAIALKLPSLVADAAAIVLVGAIVSRRAASARVGAIAAAMLALNPTSILLSAYHGNTDSVLACLTLVAWWLAERGRMTLAALAMAASLNVKVVTGPSVVVLLACAANGGELVRMLAAFAVGAVPFAIATVAVGSAFLANLFEYRPPGMSWLACVGWYARSTPIIGPVGLFFASWVQRIAMQATLLIAVCCVGVARRRRVGAMTLGATFWAAFLVWNGGAGLQYSVWPVPLLAAVRPRLALAYGVAAGVYLGWAYAAARVPGWPIESAFTLYDEPVWHRALALPLVASVALLASLLAEIVRAGRRHAPDDAPRATIDPAPAGAADHGGRRWNL